MREFHPKDFGLAFKGVSDKLLSHEGREAPEPRPATALTDWPNLADGRFAGKNWDRWQTARTLQVLQGRHQTAAQFAGEPCRAGEVPKG